MLISKNIYINKRRTSMRLDPKSWEALDRICKNENISLSTLLSLIEDYKGNIGFSVATRVFIVSYLTYMIDTLKQNNSAKSDNIILNLLTMIYKKD